MFNLEQSITDWRQQMLAAGIKTPVPLEELESHLREEIERQTKSGLSELRAFEVSAQQIGQPKMLKTEFNKSGRTFMKRTLIIMTGIFCISRGAAMILPALHLLNEQRMVHNAVVAFLFGISFTLTGITAVILGLKKRKA